MRSHRRFRVGEASTIKERNEAKISRSLHYRLERLPFELGRRRGPEAVGGIGEHQDLDPACAEVFQLRRAGHSPWVPPSSICAEDERCPARCRSSADEDRSLWPSEPNPRLSRCPRDAIAAPAALQSDPSPRMYRPQPTGAQSQFPGDRRNRLVLTTVRGPPFSERRAFISPTPPKDAKKVEPTANCGKGGIDARRKASGQAAQGRPNG